MSTLAGPLLVLVFAVTQALRDVYFGNVFQGVDFFAIILLTFVLSTIIFGIVAWRRAPQDFAKLRGHGGTIIAANLTTALAWSCYFFGLTHLDPSVVNTIHSAMGPLTVVVLGWFGLRLAQMPKTGPIENLSYLGIAASVAGLWWVVLSERSGLPVGSLRDTLLGLALLAVSGMSITVSLLYCKRLQDDGIGADMVTAVRYIAIIVLAAGVAIWKGGLGGIETIGQGATLSVAAVVLIVLPLYALQVGIGKVTPLLSQIIRALGPIFVFALAQFDDRIHYSMPVLACILLYSVSVLVSNFARGWRDEKPARPSSAPVPQARG
ncbi:MAG TPA: DMT family transporter [Xanthobacteraceae bacterium]|jgi:drug/metabolite transporter (DMT)-like permease|nr:DMT family transporter [Xanthobacteraceae bacterium]